jgi:ArsR family transcriptional regulator, arsenate/arsenite/antimonite-responsive transcriptional repressor
MMLTSLPVDVKTKSKFRIVMEVRMAVDTADVARLARIAKALADPIRLKMLGMLAEGRSCCAFPDPATRNVPGAGTPTGICVCEFQEQFGLGQSRTSYHLRVLKNAGLVTEEARGKWTFYELDQETAAASLRAFGELVGTGSPLCG